MKKYSIGETAKMMGVSVNTLRYWINEGLIEPEVVDPDSGYRYYSFNQLHYIHRVKYLRDDAVRDYMSGLPNKRVRNNVIPYPLFPVHRMFPKATHHSDHKVPRSTGPEVRLVTCCLLRYRRSRTVPDRG